MGTGKLHRQLIKLATKPTNQHLSVYVRPKRRHRQTTTISNGMHRSPSSPGLLINESETKQIHLLGSPSGPPVPHKQL